MASCPPQQSACCEENHTHADIVQGITEMTTDLQNLRCSYNDLKGGINPQLTDTTADLGHIKAIGTLRSVYKELNGIPRQPGLNKHATATLTISKHVFNNPEHSVQDLEQYSHIWLLFLFHKNKNGHTKAKVKPPRMNGQKTGVFSSRSPYRPNPIGMSLVKLEKVIGSTLHLAGIDMLDGTPVLDIKPYIPYCDNPDVLGADPIDNETHTKPHENTQGTTIAQWLEKNDIGKLTVRYTPTAESGLSLFNKLASDLQYKLEFYDSSQSVQAAITEILQNDPRSTYRRTKCADRLYFFNVDIVHVTCWFDNDSNVAEVVSCKPQPTEQNTV